VLDMNVNCLEGMRCPECGSYEPFLIGIKTVGKVFDDGVSETFDNEWDDDSYCRCCECDHEGAVADFQRGMRNEHNSEREQCKVHSPVQCAQRLLWSRL
jgi:hypothetical protein